MKTTLRLSAILITIGALSACQNTKVDGDNVGSGKVVKVGQSKLILENQGDFLFIDISDYDRESLSKLKKGEHVTLMGKIVKKNPAKADSVDETEIDQVVEDNGHVITLGHSL